MSQKVIRNILFIALIIGVIAGLINSGFDVKGIIVGLIGAGIGAVGVLAKRRFGNKGLLIVFVVSYVVFLLFFLK
jgi:hypothetical protein